MDKKGRREAILFSIEYVYACVFMSPNIAFKTYSQSQAMLLPPDLNELIDVNHPVRIINEVIDSVNIDGIIKTYKGGGTSSHHPRMLLKVLVYAYICSKEIYSLCGLQG